MEKQPVSDTFFKLIDEHKAIIYKICNSYCNNKGDREDLAQEIIYQLWKSADRFKEEYKFSTWMYRVALNVAISFYRKEKRSKEIISFPEHAIDVEDSSHTTKTTEENINLLQHFINELNELDRALMLLYLDEKSYHEIADILGITETNVATKISRVKEKLKQKFLTINQ
ncbi:MAG: sigma-70 family RNA polymerase sigma factor [Bacteroidetes bacterium]|nr:sigma-70 family RNA polymerase sigma factor [Bacteroidota bacterium]MBS1933005.1 sigma-70 family RNA polymerase sigma factor [Bacteroidota bacterium]